MRSKVIDGRDPDMYHFVELLERGASFIFRFETDALMHLCEGGSWKFVDKRVVERFKKTFNEWFVVRIARSGVFEYHAEVHEGVDYCTGVEFSTVVHE